MYSNTDKIRAVVHLNQLYNDHRRKAFVTINQSWKHVRDLELHIQKIFHISSEIYLMIDGCLLPPDEDISIITAKDNIVVYPVTASNSLPLELVNENIKKKAEISSPSGCSASNAKRFKVDTEQASPPSLFKNARTMKSQPWLTELDSIKITENTPRISITPITNELSPSQGLNPKSEFAQLANAFSHARIQSGNESSPGNCNIPSVGCIVTAAGSCSGPSLQSWSKCSKWIDDVNLIDDGVTKITPGDAKNNAVDIEAKLSRPRGRPRKRRRKPKSATLTVVPETDVPAVASTSSRCDVPTPISTSHIRFTDQVAQAEIQLNVTKPAIKVSEAVLLPPTTRVFRATCKYITKGDASVPLTNNAAIKETACGVSSAEIPLTVDIKDQQAIETLRKNVDNLNLKTVTNPFNENDVIAFKIIKMTNKYQPVLSEYIIGLLSKVDCVTGNTTVSVLAGADELKQPDGKFSIKMEDNIVASPTNTNEVVLAISDILYPKYVNK